VIVPCVPCVSRLPPVLSNREPSINANRGFANKVFQNLQAFLRFEPLMLIAHVMICNDRNKTQCMLK
jgi:hypothetical protein